jgi:hypothetical protein
MESRPIHFEILAKEPEKMSTFYRELFGWKIAAWEGPMAYWMVTTGPEGTPGINGGMMRRELPQAVINTVCVDSLEASLARVEALGGRKIMGPNDIPGIGKHAYCADPEGTIFGMLQPVK